MGVQVEASCAVGLCRVNISCRVVKLQLFQTGGVGLFSLDPLNPRVSHEVRVGGEFEATSGIQEGINTSATPSIQWCCRVVEQYFSSAIIA